MKKKPLYEKIFQNFKDKILSGEYKPNEKLPSEREITILFDVSRITAVRALRELEQKKYITRVQGSGSYITEKKWMKESPVEELENNLSIISVIFPHHNEFFSEILRGIEDVAKKMGYFVTYHNSWENPRIEKKIVKDIISKGSDGIILFPIQPFQNNDIYSRLIIEGYPIVLIDRKLPGLEETISVVSVDNFSAFHMITTHLLELGHKKIVMIAPEVNNVSSEYDRYKGYCKAHIDYGTPFMKNHLYSFEDLDEMPDDYRAEENLEWRSAHFFFDLIEKADEDERPTAIAAVNDVTAEVVILVALERGLSIPGDFSVTGFDDVSFASHLPVPLTTIRQPAQKIGGTVAKELFEIVANPDKKIENHNIKGGLVIRESTAPPREKKN